LHYYLLSNYIFRKFTLKGHCCTINLLCSTQCLGAPRVFISDFDNDLVISCSFLQRWDVRSYGFDIKKCHHLRVQFSVRLCKCFLQCIFCQICCYAQWFSANCMPIDYKRALQSLWWLYCFLFLFLHLLHPFDLGFVWCCCNLGTWLLNWIFTMQSNT